MLICGRNSLNFYLFIFWLWNILGREQDDAMLEEEILKVSFIFSTVSGTKKECTLIVYISSVLKDVLFFHFEETLNWF